MEPATASYVHRLMGLGPKTQILDISNACLGFLNALILAGSLIETGQIRRAILVAGENGAPLVDKTIELLNEGPYDRKSIKPFFANLTIGAGAVAWSITRRDLAPLLLHLLVLGFAKRILHTMNCVREIPPGMIWLCKRTPKNFFMQGLLLPPEPGVIFLDLHKWKSSVPELVIYPPSRESTYSCCTRSYEYKSVHQFFEF